MRRRRHLADYPRRLVAAGGIALVLLLTALTASPELHRLFHGPDDSGAEDGCAVAQFAQGVSVAPDTAIVATTPAQWRVLDRPGVAEILLASPRFLHPPERGPPFV